MLLCHTSDSHLNEDATASQGRIIRNPSGENVRWLDRIRCAMAVVVGAIDRKCDIFLHAGDLFDRSRPTPKEYTTANTVLDAAAEHMHVVVCADNHGLSQAADDPHAIEPIRGRKAGLHICSRPTVLRLKTTEGMVQVAVLPYPRSALVAAKAEMQGKPPEQINAAVSEKLTLLAEKLLADCDPSLPRILVAHVMIAGSRLTAKGGEIETGGICLPRSALKGWDYVALGDVHVAQHFPETQAYYSGSTDRCNFGEEADTKSWNLVALDTIGAPARVVHIETPARRYITLSPEEITPDRLLKLFGQPDLESFPIVRLKAEMTFEDYRRLGPALQEWRKIPYFLEDVAIIRTARARHESMTGMLTAEQALALWCQQHERTDTEALLVEHATLSTGA